MLKPKQQQLAGALTLDSTWRELKGPKGPQLITQLSKVEFVFYQHLISKSWHLYIGTLSR